MQHDKAVGKAYSYAQRLMTLKTLHIQSGDEDCEDGDEEYDKPRAEAKGADAEEPSALPPDHFLTGRKSVTAVALKAAADELGDQGIPAIGRPKAKGKTLTPVEQKLFIKHVRDNGVAQTDAVKLLKKHKYAKTADIPQTRLGFFKSEITRLGQEASTNDQDNQDASGPANLERGVEPAGNGRQGRVPDGYPERP